MSLSLATWLMKKWCVRQWPNPTPCHPFCMHMGATFSQIVLLWADLWCVVLSPWDTCIDQFNTRPPTFETSPGRDISSPARPRTDKYQWEQRTCLSYPLWLRWTQHATASPNCFFVVIHALGCSEPRQRGVLCGLVWLWLSVALNTASSQGDWQALHSSPIGMNDNLSPTSANHIATTMTERRRMKRPCRQLFICDVWCLCVKYGAWVRTRIV